VRQEHSTKTSHRHSLLNSMFVLDIRIDYRYLYNACRIRIDEVSNLKNIDKISNNYSIVLI